MAALALPMGVLGRPLPTDCGPAMGDGYNWLVAGLDGWAAGDWRDMGLPGDVFGGAGKATPTWNPVVEGDWADVFPGSTLGGAGDATPTLEPLVDGDWIDVGLPGGDVFGGAGEDTPTWELVVPATLFICAILCCMKRAAWTCLWFLWSRRFFLMRAHTGTGHLSTLQLLA